MKKLLSFILLSSSLAHATIIPVDNPQRPVQDELFSYQWGLFNQGQTLIREKDDIHNVPMKGVLNKDIGWTGLVGKWSTKRPIVAVLDSGVDLTHPELQGNLWKNEGECGKDPTKDNDGNKLAGDCHGWNFTEAIESDAAKDPSDVDGHGTHIAGVIAALNNGSGIVGVVPNALIMPVKVMKDADSESEVHSSEAFARGILYAVDNGADVINMSLGWPRSLETKLLRDAVYYALSKGVPIVAAAGNNNSADPLFPCAYDGVICVGASTVNGEFAGFSNYGGHVDTIAPGEGILGLHPVVFEPEFFSVPGYEIRSGSSQSTPFVAGLIAALKAKQADLTIDQIFAKLYQGESFKQKNKYILGNEATWKLLNAEIKTSIVRPILKKVRQIVFRGQELESKLAVSVRNFGLPSGVVQVKVESLSKALKFSSEAQTIEKLNQGEFKDLNFNVSLKDMNAESVVSVKITITQGNESRTYMNEISVVRDVQGEEKFKKSLFEFSGEAISLGVQRGSQILPLLNTVESFAPSAKHEFFMKRVIKDGEAKKLEITLFSKKADKYVEAPNNIYVNDANTLVNFIRVDMNLDGNEDYLVQTVAGEGDKKYFVFSFYNQDLEPLWPSFQDATLALDLYLESVSDLTFVKYHHATLGKIRVPAFFTLGMLPKVDQPISSWDRLDSNRKNRLYYLEPGPQNNMVVRSLTTNIWEERVKKELKTKWFATVETEQLLPVSESDAVKGELRVLVTVGEGTKRQIFIFSFSALSENHGPKIPQLVLQSETVDSLLKVTDEGLRVNGDVYFNIYDRTRSKLVITKDLAQERELIFKHEDEFDLIAGHLTTFETEEDSLSIFQSREKLITVSRTSDTRTTRPKLRYSFLSQKLLSEMYLPLTYKRDGKNLPALYVDATSITGNRVYLFEEQKGALVSSIRNSLIVPNGCKSMNPTYSRVAGTYEFIFLCLEDKNWVIRSYKMN